MVQSELFDTEQPRFGRAWAMPNKWTFQIPPIAEFISRYWTPDIVSVDPFSGTSELATYRNDLGSGGMGAVEFLSSLSDQGVVADLLFLDPPYSPRQISECYKRVGLKCGMADTQNARLMRQVRDAASLLLRKDSIILSFGWNSGGFGRGSVPLEYLLVAHGGAHNDTICVAEKFRA